MTRKLLCPRCSRILTPQILRKIKHTTGVLLDVCDSCGGMWVDGNEINTLLNGQKKQKRRSKK